MWSPKRTSSGSQSRARQSSPSTPMFTPCGGQEARGQGQEALGDCRVQRLAQVNSCSWPGWLAGVRAGGAELRPHGHRGAPPPCGAHPAASEAAVLLGFPCCVRHRCAASQCTHEGSASMMQGHVMWLQQASGALGAAKASMKSRGLPAHALRWPPTWPPACPQQRAIVATSFFALPTPRTSCALPPAAGAWPCGGRASPPGSARRCTPPRGPACPPPPPPPKDLRIPTPWMRAGCEAAAAPLPQERSPAPPARRRRVQQRIAVAVSRGVQLA